MKRSTFYLILAAIIPLAMILWLHRCFSRRQKSASPRPRSPPPPATARPISSPTIAGSTWSSSGTTTAAPTPGSSTTAATCRTCKSSGRAKASSGSRCSLRLPASRVTSPPSRRTTTCTKMRRAHRRAARSHRHDRPSLRCQDHAADGRDRSHGVVIYDGAIDDKPTTDLATFPARRITSSLALAASHGRQARGTPRYPSLRLLGEVFRFVALKSPN